MAFDPNAYMTTISGNAYLPVAARLAWFRDRYPNGQVFVNLVQFDVVPVSGGGQTERVIFKARVDNGEGSISEGYGSETQNDFRDHIEKASTKALGRALAAAGFGTMESGNEYTGEGDAGRPVDAPVRTNQPAPTPIAARQAPQQGPQGNYAQPPQQNAPRPQGSTQGAYQGAPPQRQGPQGNNYQQAQAQQQGNSQYQGDPNRPASPRQVQYVKDLLSGMGHDPERFDWSGLTAGEASTYINTLRSGQLPQDVADALAQIGG